LCEYVVNGKTAVTEDAQFSSMFYQHYKRECHLRSSKRKKYNIHGANNLNNFVEELLRASLVNICAPSVSEYRLRQVNDFSWADSRMLMTVYARLRTNVLCHEYEVNSGTLTMNDHNKTGVCGRYDIVSGYRLYEIKTVDELSNEHFMQTIIYDLIRQMTSSLADAKSSTEVALTYMKALRDNYNSRDAYRLGDPVVGGFIYEFVADGEDGTSVKIIDQHGNIKTVSGDKLIADTSFFDTQIKTLEDDISANKFRTFLYNVRSNEMFEITITDIGALYNYLSCDFGEAVGDDDFIRMAKCL